MKPENTDVLKLLYGSVSQRKRPEDVAELILQLLGDKLTPGEKSTLGVAAQGSIRRSLWGYTSMLQTFAKPIGAEKQIRKVIELFGLSSESCTAHCDPAAIEFFLVAASGLIGKQYRQSNFVENRFNKWQRKALGMELSKRQYNKRFRLLKRLEEKLRALIRDGRKAEFAQLAKHGLAHHITWEEFSRDGSTACFVAYYTARCNLRSEFTIAGQQKPCDEIADMLFNRCAGETKRSFWDSFTANAKAEGRTPVNTTNWWAIAHAYPDPRVLVRLTDEQKGMLLGKWTGILEDIASMLREVWESSEITRATMVVKRGNDSSTWNSTAGAWNKARGSWINLVHSLGLEAMLEEVCFGKVLRLMAADVVAWHLRAGGKLDPNTVVWNELPLPWQVFAGEAICTKEMVEIACRKAGLDPEKSGWSAPRPHGVVPFRPTPELVHGVSISNPFLAKVLKRHHYFSGRANAKMIHPERN